MSVKSLVRGTADQARAFYAWVCARNWGIRLGVGAVALILVFLTLNFFGIRYNEALIFGLLFTGLAIFLYPIRVLGWATKRIVRKESPSWVRMLGYVGAALVWGATWLGLTIMVHYWHLPLITFTLGIPVAVIVAILGYNISPVVARAIIGRAIPGLVFLTYGFIVLTLRTTEITVSKTEMVVDISRISAGKEVYENENVNLVMYTHAPETHFEMSNAIGEKFRIWYYGKRFGGTWIQLYRQIIWAEKVVDNPPAWPVRIAAIHILSLLAASFWLWTLVSKRGIALPWVEKIAPKWRWARGPQSLSASVDAPAPSSEGSGSTTDRPSLLTPKWREEAARRSG